MFGKGKKKDKYTVTFSFSKTEMVNIYNFAKLVFEDEHICIDWASGNICKINYKDITATKIVHHGLNSWVEIMSKQLTVYVTCSKNRDVMQRINEICGL